MKKTYETPSMEIVRFQYRDQVVAESGGKTCSTVWVHQGDGTGGCMTTPEYTLNA